VATVLLPRSLLALFPGVERRHEVRGESVAAVIEALDLTVPGLRDRLVESGPRLRPHINVFVDGSPAALNSPVPPDAVIHVIPAVSGGARSRGRAPTNSSADSAPPSSDRCG
jgi:molybdopterin converting factor small subunit